MKYICKENYAINDILVGNKGDILEITDAVPKRNENLEDISGYVDIKNLTTNKIYEATYIDVDDNILEKVNMKF